MKRSELQKCAFCKQGVMSSGVPLFWRISIERFCVDVSAVQRLHGLETFFGGGSSGAMLAGAMGQNEDIAVPLMEKKLLVLCDWCALKVPIAALSEMEAIKA